MFKLKSLIREDQETARKVWSMRDLEADSLTRMKLAHEAFPYAIHGFTDYLSPLRGGGLNLVWWAEAEAFAIFDLGGFLTIVDTTEEVVNLLKDEAKECGNLRRLITGVNPFESHMPEPKPYKPEVKERLNISLDDLDLKF